jgi:hypothetical protein
MEAAKVKVADINSRIALQNHSPTLKEHKIDKLKVVFSSEIQDENSLK